MRTLRRLLARTLLAPFLLLPLLSCSYPKPSEKTVATALVRTGGFEAVLTWATGVDEKRPFLVSTLESPARLVIDVKSSG